MKFSNNFQTKQLNFLETSNPSQSTRLNSLKIKRGQIISLLLFHSKHKKPFTWFGWLKTSLQTHYDDTNHKLLLPDFDPLPIFTIIFFCFVHSSIKINHLAPCCYHFTYSLKQYLNVKSIRTQRQQKIYTKTEKKNN